MFSEILFMKARSAGSLVRKAGALCSLPEAVEQLSRVLTSPATSHGEIGEVILHDPGLAARLLRLANGRPGMEPGVVETVSAALGSVGREELSELVATTPATRLFRGIASDLLDMERFWMNSIACGMVARALAFRCRLYHTEPLFLAGLLHKIGRLVMLSTSPERYSRVLSHGALDEDGLNREEFRVFGFNHAHVGAELLRYWRLPESLFVPVGHYLAPDKAPAFRRSAALIHVASALAGEIEPAVELPEEDYRRGLNFERGAWDLLGLPLSSLRPIIDESQLQALEVYERMHITPLDDFLP